MDFFYILKISARVRVFCYIFSKLLTQSRVQKENIQIQGPDRTMFEKNGKGLQSD